MESRLSLRSRGAIARWISVLPLAVACLSLTPIHPAFASERSMERTLTVTGQGIEMVATTITQVQLGVEVQGETAAEVQREAAARSSRVVNYLRSRNVRKLQTTGISLNPVYNYRNNEQRIVGYSASNIVSFELDTDAAGEVMDEAVRQGATRINGVSFIASDEALARAREIALREATEDARTQANVVLSALGLRNQEVVGIQINATTPMPRPYPVMAARAMDSAPSTPVVGGEQQVQASVTLQIRY